MPKHNSLETPRSIQFVARSDPNRVEPILPSLVRAMSLRPARNPQTHFVPRRAPRPSVVSVADTFVSFLVAAGSCRNHAPRSRFFATASQRSSHASAVPIPVQNNPGEIRATYTPSTQEGLDRREPQQRSKHDDEGSEEQCCTAVATSRLSRSASTSNEKPPAERRVRDFLPLELRNLRNGSYFRNVDLKHLFNFYVDVLGYEDGVQALKVVLSNPNREMAAQTLNKNNQHCKDQTHIPGVSRLLTLLEDRNSSNQQLFTAYKRIPSPAVAYLSNRTRGILLHRFANPPRPRRVYGQRFLTIVDDMCKASLSLSPAYWTAAIHAAGKYSAKVTDSDLSNVVELWRRMENEGGIQSSSVTFNVLFDIAVKGGHFKFAERVLKEATKRGVHLSRFGRVAQIYYKGVQGDATGVREAYHSFVQAGEVVDTVVLNCVIASLIRAGRFDLAEKMYERMREVHNVLANRDAELRPKSLSPLRHDNYAAYRNASKKLGRVLGMSAFLYDKLPEQHRVLQSALPLTPDSKTFAILLSYHAFQSGDLERFIALLREMEVHFEIPPRTIVYILLFQGFSVHGRAPKTPWTFERLQAVWAAFRRAVDHSHSEIRSRSSTKKRMAKFIWENPLTGNTNTVVRQFPSVHNPRGHRHASKSEDKNESLSDNDTLEHDYHDEEDDNEDKWRYENTIFLGRKVVVSALHAYSVCGGPAAVRELWSQIKPHWTPKHQKLADVVAVKKVVRRLGR